MKTILAVLAVAALSFGPAQAAVTATSSGYEVSYDFSLWGTLNGHDVTNLVILETDGTNFNASFGYSAPSNGATTLTHTIEFHPTKALLIGLDLIAVGVGENKTHLIMGMDSNFFAASLGLQFSDVFPAQGTDARVTHSQVISAVLGAEGGNATDLDLLRNFFMTGAGSFAAFDPNGSFTVGEFSTLHGTVPEPAPWSLMILGFAALGTAMRRRARHAI